MAFMTRARILLNGFGLRFGADEGLRNAVSSVFAVVVVSFCVLVPNGYAVEPDEVLSDPVLESRARTLSATLRCVVCQNQSIDSSDAPLAHDLRLLVRERLKAGDTDDEVIAYLVARYGEFVLLRPAFGLHTVLLWLAPVGVLAFALYLAFGVLRRRASDRAISADAAAGPGAGDVALSPEEEERLRELLVSGVERGADGTGKSA